eukprot:435217_1
MSLSLTSPLSPLSPPNTTMFDYKTAKASEISDALNKIGFVECTKIDDSLQGGIYRAKSKSLQSAVIKVSNQSLCHNSSAIIGHKSYKVKENILLEKSILKFLTQQKHCPDSIVKFMSFFKTKTHYYLVMEDGGMSLFEFTRQMHRLIKMGHVGMDEWQAVIKIILKQMVECIDYIHSKNVCHFDISLENFLINDIPIEVQHYKNKSKKKK